MKKLMLICVVMLLTSGVANAVLVSDDFQDDNYTNNPTWTVEAGEWSVWHPWGLPNAVLDPTPANETGENRVRTTFAAYSGDWTLTANYKQDGGANYNYHGFYVGSTTSGQSYYIQPNDVGNVNMGGPNGSKVWTAQSNDGDWYALTASWTAATKTLAVTIVNTTAGGSWTDSYTETGTAVTSFDYLDLGTHNNWKDTMFDDILLVPEPATMALLGLGSLAMLRRKKA